jgi:Rrf2 family cysteine metabolism transcriptional repressor
MRLNTKMRYGTRAMLELAMHYQEGTVSLSEVAASQEISEKYLEVLFASLRLAGTVRSQRGSKGGYVLAKPPEQITLREIFDILESPVPSNTVLVIVGQIALLRMSGLRCSPLQCTC